MNAVANQFDFVVVDSWQKLNTPMARLDELRREFPNTIWIIITQETTWKAREPKPIGKGKVTVQNLLGLDLLFLDLHL